MSGNEIQQPQQPNWSAAFNNAASCAASTIFILGIATIMESPLAIVPVSGAALTWYAAMKVFAEGLKEPHPGQNTQAQALRQEPGPGLGPG